LLTYYESEFKGTFFLGKGFEACPPSAWIRGVEGPRGQGFKGSKFTVQGSQVMAGAWGFAPSELRPHKQGFI